MRHHHNHGFHVVQTCFMDSHVWYLLCRPPCIVGHNHYCLQAGFGHGSVLVQTCFADSHALTAKLFQPQIKPFLLKTRPLILTLRSNSGQQPQNTSWFEGSRHRAVGARASEGALLHASGLHWQSHAAACRSYLLERFFRADSQTGVSTKGLSATPFQVASLAFVGTQLC